jgi:glycosyltransferase involved in cell wall biosynthesis
MRMGDELSSDLQVLIISFAFAPDGEIGAKRVTRLCGYLPEFGIQPIVVTVQERFLIRRDDSFSPPPGVRVERTTVWQNPLQWYAGLKKRIVPPPTSGNASPLAISAERARNGHRGLVRRHLLGLLQTPDQFVGWYLPAIKAAERLIEREPIALILSSGPPFTTHLVACHLRKKHGIPWVADFRDGWGTSHVLEARWERAVNARMEASCLRRADLVICNTEALRRSFVERHPLLQPKKFATITNGFDNLCASPVPLEAPKRSTRLFLHLGTIYGRRRIDTFCQAVSDLVNAGNLHPSSFKILFQGETDASSVAAVHQRAPGLVRDRCIEFQPFIDNWRQAQELMWRADLLLIFSGSPLEVPAKFYDYLKTGKPIFAIAEPGALTELLDSTGSGIWADPADPAGIAAGLLRALELPSVTPEEAERRWSSQFHFRSLTAQLAGWIRRLAVQHSTGAGSGGTKV